MADNRKISPWITRSFQVASLVVVQGLAPMPARSAEDVTPPSPIEKLTDENIQGCLADFRAGRVVVSRTIGIDVTNSHGLHCFIFEQRLSTRTYAESSGEPKFEITAATRVVGVIVDDQNGDPVATLTKTASIGPIKRMVMDIDVKWESDHSNHHLRVNSTDLESTLTMGKAPPRDKENLLKLIDIVRRLPNHLAS